MILVALALQAATAAAPSDACPFPRDGNPATARAASERWRSEGGGFVASACVGLAATAQGRYAEAAAAFDAAARAAELAHDGRAATYWAQAGNAWLAGGDAAKARGALDAALAAGTLTGAALGEAQLDHARALVAAGETEAARTDIDLALTHVPDDPLAWLLSATLARRDGDGRRAAKDIGEALRRSADDASVQLEAGNVAALNRDEAGARAAWAEAARLAPDAPAGRAAVAALRQFDAPAAAAKP